MIKNSWKLWRQFEGRNIQQTLNSYFVEKLRLRYKNKQCGKSSMG